MERYMEHLKKVLRNGFATTAIVCLVSFGVAAQTSSSDQTTTTKHHQKAMSSETSSSGSSQLSAADKAFVKKAAQGGMAEVELGQLATQKAQSEDVKKFGQRMVDDHSKANDQLKTLASEKGVTLPTDLDAKDKALKNRLSKLSGDQFDRAYMQSMVQDHKKDVAEFQKESRSAKDSDVKNWASQTLPTLQSHLQQAEQVHQAELKEGPAKKSATTASNQSQ
jgi:putative membrane protein